MTSLFTIWSSAIILFFVIDPFGNIPIIMAILKPFPRKRQFQIIVRELLIGLVILLIFLYGGKYFLSIFHFETEAVTIAGGIIFLVIALRMIFPAQGSAMPMVSKDEDPLIVPIAIPMISGPSALATLIVMSESSPGSKTELLLALLGTWLVSSLILIGSPIFYSILKEKGLKALEKLMGMLLLIMAVQMFINGMRGLLPSLKSLSRLGPQDLQIQLWGVKFSYARKIYHSRQGTVISTAS